MPWPVANHSASRAPTRARGAAIRSDAISAGRALGACTFHSVLAGDAP